MNHKISEFCDKIDSIKKMSDRLREMKYGPVKTEKILIDNMKTLLPSIKKSLRKKSMLRMLIK